MSVQAISWVLDHSKSTGATRCVLISIANHVGADGEGWAYVQQVMQEANCSHHTYLRAIQWAADNGELARELNKGAAKKAAVNRRPNHFRFLLVGSPDEAVPNVDTPPERTPQVDQIGDPKNGHPEPSLVLEPYKEPLPAKRASRKTHAHVLTEQHWNDTKPRPVLKGGFVALRNIVQKLEDAGYDDETILLGLRTTRAYTLDAIQFALREGQGKKRGMDLSGIEAMLTKAGAS